jgi:hypothetical protein
MGRSTRSKGDKRLNQWWKPQADRKVLLTVRHGPTAIEFEKGKDPVLLDDRKELAAVLPKLIVATEVGELDGHINAVREAKQPVVAKRLQARLLLGGFRIILETLWQPSGKDPL